MRDPNSVDVMRLQKTPIVDLLKECDLVEGTESYWWILDDWKVELKKKYNDKGISEQTRCELYDKIEEVNGLINGEETRGNKTISGDNIKNYEIYKNSLDNLVKDSGIDLKKLTVKVIYEQVKQTDNKLWGIKFTTFVRNVWPSYSKEKGLKKQPGRPRKK